MWERQSEPIIFRQDNTSDVKYGGGNILVWGCLGYNVVRICTEVEGRIDAKMYVEILDCTCPKVWKSWEFL
jgi:hypothetical protein